MPLFVGGKQINVPEQENKDENSIETLDNIPSGNEESTGFIDAGRAFFAQENPLFGPIKDLASQRDTTIDLEFDPFAALDKERPDLQEFEDRFVDVRNENDFQRRVFQIDYELDQRAILDKAPTITKLASGLAASVIDPTILVPYAGVARKVNTLARAGEGLAVGAAAGLSISSLRESLLLSDQETRTTDEAITNILAETAFGGILGAGVGALANPVKIAGQKVLSKALQGEDFKINVSESGSVKIARDDSAGASATADQLEDLGLAHLNEKLAKVLSGPEGLRPPDLRAILSPSASVRKIGETFYNSNYIRNKNLEGIPTAQNAQNAIARADTNVESTLNDVTNLYLDYAKTNRLSAAIKTPKNAISQTEFTERMWKVMLNDTARDSIEQVNKAAVKLRKDMDTMTKKLQEAELLPKDIDPTIARNYGTRIYNLKSLASNQAQGRFISKVKNWIKLHEKDGKLRVKPLDDEKADIFAEDTLAKIRGESNQQIAMRGISENFISKGKFLKEDQLMIPESEIAEFLDKDAAKLFKNYMYRANRLLETQAALKRAGFDSIEDVKKAIQFEGQKAKRGLEESDSLNVKIDEEFKEAERLTDLMYRSMLGQLRKPGKGDRLTETLLTYQFTRLLGGVTISSIPELMMVPFRQGFLKTLREGYLPMLRDIKTSSYSKDQLTDLIGAFEFEKNNVLRAQAGFDDINQLGRSTNTLDTINQTMGTVQTIASGINYWTAGNRRVAAQVASSDIVRTLKRFKSTGKMSKKDTARLATNGIGRKDYDRLLAQIDKHVQNYNGTNVVNPHLWDDQEALNIFKNAVQQEVEGSILKPGVESLPFVVQENGIARLMFQFKSFMSAATGKITLSSLQRRDANTLIGLMSLITMGSITGLLKDKLAGRELNTDPEILLLDGISRSGVAGLLGTTLLDTTLTFADPKTRRFGGKFVSGAILGPSAGQIEELVRMMQGLTQGGVTDKEIKGVLRMMPFNNLFYIKAMTDRVFDQENK